MFYNKFFHNFLEKIITIMGVELSKYNVIFGNYTGNHVSTIEHAREMYHCIIYALYKTINILLQDNNIGTNPRNWNKGKLITVGLLLPQIGANKITMLQEVEERFYICKDISYICKDSRGRFFSFRTR